MPIIDLQRRLREVGRLRTGEQVRGPDGKVRPTKLATFRFTSPDNALIAAASMLYGGEMREWQAPSGRQWEVVTEADGLDVVVPTADMALSQFYETWSAGGCQKRCDGHTDYIADGPCSCDPADRECQPTTRLNVLIPDLPGVGFWRAESHGYYAAAELAGVVSLLDRLARGGRFVVARLAIDERMVKRPNAKTGKPETRRFTVLTLDPGLTINELTGGAAPALPSGNGELASPAGTPAPDAPPEPPHGPSGRSVREQVAALADREPRARTPLPDTGVEPRTASEAAETVPGAPAAPPPPSPPSPAEDDGGAAPPPSTTDPDTARRRIMAEAQKAWPDQDKATREDFRHALGVIATAPFRREHGHDPVSSVSEMTMQERLRLSTLLNDVRTGKMVMAYDPVGAEDGATRVLSWLSQGKKTAVLTKLDDGTWDVVVREGIPANLDGEPF